MHSSRKRTAHSSSRRGGAPPGTPQDQNPLEHSPPPRTMHNPPEQAPPGTRHPRSIHPPGIMHTPQSRHPLGPCTPRAGTPLWDHAPPPHRPGTPPGAAPPGAATPPMDRHTPVNILPCPKLRFRVVISRIPMLCYLWQWQIQNFPEGSTNPKGEAPAKFHRKLHANEEHRKGGGGGASAKNYNADPPLYSFISEKVYQEPQPSFSRVLYKWKLSCKLSWEGKWHPGAIMKPHYNVQLI